MNSLNYLKNLPNNSQCSDCGKIITSGWVLMDKNTRLLCSDCKARAVGVDIKERKISITFKEVMWGGKSMEKRVFMVTTSNNIVMEQRLYYEEEINILITNPKYNIKIN